MGTILELEQNVTDAISARSIRLSQQVRQLASDLCHKTEASPYAADTLKISNQVNSLCDYVERLHVSVETLLATIDAVGGTAAGRSEAVLTDEEKKAIEIQREVHELNPTAKEAIKALFMWRDSPEQRLREDGNRA